MRRVALVCVHGGLGSTNHWSACASRVPPALVSRAHAARERARLSACAGAPSSPSLSLDPASAGVLVERVSVLDLPGWGARALVASDARASLSSAAGGEQPLELSAYVDDVRRMLSEWRASLPSDTRAMLVGFSFGACMSSLAWLAQPELFDGAAFVGPGGFGGAPSATFPGMRAMGERLALDDASLRGALAGDFDPAAQNAAQVLGTLRKHMAAMVCNRAVALAHARDALANVRAASLPVDLAARWNRSTDLPALLRANAERLPLARVHATWGDEDVCVLGTLDERVAQFRGVLGGANVSVLRGAGHCAMWDAPDATADWLAGVVLRAFA